MNKLFLELENENVLRSFPFASGCLTRDTSGAQIGTGVLIDGIFYPVNSSGVLFLSRIDPTGVVSISDDSRVVMTATFIPGTSTLEFYDTTDLKRHAGTLIASSVDALASLVNVYETRTFTAEETMFASSCIFPVQNDGVLSIKVPDVGVFDGEVSFSNTALDPVRVSTDASGSTLRFDVIPLPEIVELSSIKHIYCIVDGKTPFRIQKINLAQRGGGNTIMVYLDNIDKDDICTNSHRENTIVSVDTCDCQDPEYKPLPPQEIPEVYQTEVVDIPNGADNAFYLVAKNTLGYTNPLSITLVEGTTAPKMDLDEVVTEGGVEVLTDSITSKGVVLQVPGLA